MSTPATPSPPRASEIDDVADILVIGGGPAGAWAALGAVASGARSVALVDKGYCGTSGATAPANTGAWYVTPEGDARERAIEARYARSGGLAHRAWMARVLDATWEQINLLAEWGYPFPLDDSGLQYRANLRGPDYMYFLRRQLRHLGGPRRGAVRAAPRRPRLREGRTPRRDRRPPARRDGGRARRQRDHRPRPAGGAAARQEPLPPGRSAGGLGRAARRRVARRGGAPPRRQRRQGPRARGRRAAALPARAGRAPRGVEEQTTVGP
ncbi:FAD-binding protein [Sorangium sp. So ce542]|uniref:FAD-binding protein n=1 Tax=Sorangium sp. So ce542 TaxID=3133316 RepID=UPI003F5F3322